MLNLYTAVEKCCTFREKKTGLRCYYDQCHGVKLLRQTMCAEAGQRSAVIYSMLSSSLSLGIDPAEYLQDLFERLLKARTSEIKSLTPAARPQILKHLN